MSNLLEKASIITTPTAYSSGFIHSVKPSESPYADFTFTRNSPATRVNSQGIVESVQILGSNVVTNGDFSQIGSELITNGDFATNTDWTLNDWTIADGKASLVNGSSLIIQNGILEAGKTYKIQYEILEHSSGTIRWRANQVNGSTNASVKLVTDFITVAGTTFSIQGYNSFTGSISNISAVEIIDWTAGDGWSFGGNKASCDGTQTDVTNLIQAISTNIQNQLVKISFTLDISAGTLSGSLNNSGGTEFDALTTSGNYSIEATSGDVNPNIVFQGNADFVGSISNVVIKSITNDTDLPRINYENGSGSWLLEPQSINLFLNSETLSTQNVTTESSTYTVSFYGTGSVVFTGTHIETLNGTGLNDRVTTTFTSTSGTLTCTVTGSVKFAQLEQKAFATSYIPTSGSPQTRSQDLAANAGNSDLINSTEGVLYAEIARDANGAASGGIQINNGSVNNSIRMFFNQTNTISVITAVGNVNNVIKTAQSITSSTDINKFALRYKLNDYKMYYNGSELWSRTTNALVWPVGTLNNIDFKNQNTPFNGKAKCVAVFKEALTDAELICLTTI